MERVNLGDKVKDRISGVEGVVTSRTEFMYGCVRLGIQPTGSHDGAPINAFTTDEPQVEMLERGAIENAVAPDIAAEARTHGDRPMPLSRPSITSR